MKVDMSPEAVTNRLKIMEQLWELSINLMQAKEVSKDASSLRKDLNKTEENEAWKDLEKLQTI